MIPPNHSADKAVFDPAYRKAGSYWQWSNVAIDASWERAAENVHKGWPAKPGSVDDQSALCFGVLDENAGNRWLYRVYPGGRDSFGRPGRYFFVLFRLQSPEQVLDPEVSGLLSYFDAERGLPLNVGPLDGDIPGGKPDDLLEKLHRRWVSGNQGGHWGMDGSGNVIGFASPASKPSARVAPPLSPPPPLQLPERKSGIGLAVTGVVGLTAGLLLGYVAGYYMGTKVTATQLSAKPPVAPNPEKPEPRKSNERPDPERRMEAPAGK